LIGADDDFFHFDIKFLGRAAIRIVNEVSGINCVACHIIPNPGAIESE
jgi:hypothetical protein